MYTETRRKKNKITKSHKNKQPNIKSAKFHFEIALFAPVFVDSFILSGDVTATLEDRPLIGGFLPFVIEEGSCRAGSTDLRNAAAGCTSGGASSSAFTFRAWAKKSFAARWETFSM